jgi:hypothetical protein
MLKKLIVPLLLMALGNVLCKAQQYFTGTVTYRYNVKGISPDTVRLQVEYAYNYARISPLSKDLSGEKIEGEVIIDWLIGAVYMLNTQEKEVVKRFFKKGDSLIHTSKEFPDSITIITGAKARLRNITTKDSIQFDCWLADSLILRLHPELQNDSDFFLFFMDKVVLKLESKYSNTAEAGVSSFREIIMEAEAITFTPPHDSAYILPTDYKVIDEAEQQRISDSIMREFKKIDSSLLMSSDKQVDSLMYLVKKLDSLKNLPRNKGVNKDKKPPPSKKRKPAVKKNTARKPSGLP